MARKTRARARPSIQISLERASRLHRLVVFLNGPGRSRDAVLRTLGIGLRTFYRELELLKRCGIDVRYESKLYTLVGTAAEAEGRLPFPDPRLSFAEMAELARGDSPIAQRLSVLYLQVVAGHDPSKPGRKKREPSGKRK